MMCSGCHLSRRHSQTAPPLLHIIEPDWTIWTEKNIMQTSNNAGHTDRLD